ncbi:MULTISPECIES: hypothetical protein [unclassified Rathayibacter]|uniref:hypothetical protein n=1 Tax=unclassified Rathayibacter TaxID=2609250 RepID=UPI0006FF355F|nr:MULTISPECIES: hypothetical protein [unclassified Rathayibacter]KQQ05290.1 hypothetical protein ASF42_01370 [Rathayibacter sp. Leaf294]KQS13152.1 hypothetical protein ASG06_01370 [Rathayibacter sp. Leaf185]
MTTALDSRPALRSAASPVAGTVTLSVRSIERTALAIVHEELGVDVSAIRVRLSDDDGGLALSVSTPVVLADAATAGTVLDRLHRDRTRIAARMQALTGRSVSRVDIRVTGTRTRSTRRVA